MSIRILIADDFFDVRDYFRMVLSKECDFEIVGTAGSGGEAVELAMEKQPDVILMDITMEGKLSGIEATGRIKAKLPGTKVIILTMHDDDEILFQAFSTGAEDYLIKDSSLVEVIQSIKNVYANQLALRPEISKKIQQEFTRMRGEKLKLIETLNIISNLTNSEFEIIRACCMGKKYRQIAKERCVEEVTIRTHVNNILRKFAKRRMKEVVELMRETDIMEIYVPERGA